LDSDAKEGSKISQCNLDAKKETKQLAKRLNKKEILMI